MGAWGVGLFSNDTSSDLKGKFQEVVRLPMSDVELVAVLRDEFPLAGDADDEEYTDFWLTLADLFHAYGIENAEVFETARRIVTSGADLDMKRALEMSEADLRGRAKVLDKLIDKWATPNPKPRTRRMMKAPEPFLFAPGDCVIYPTQNGNAAPAFMPAAEIAGSFTPDGWGAFAVLATTHRYGFWACYLVATLHVTAKTRPTIAGCAKASVRGLDQRFPGIPVDPLVKVVTTSRAEAKKLGLDRAGQFDLDHAALRKAFPDGYETLDQPSWSLPGLLRLYPEGILAGEERPVAMKEFPMSRFLP